jgi:hypothetical protein
MRHLKSSSSHDEDYSNKEIYRRRRQAEAIEWAKREQEMNAERIKRGLRDVDKEVERQDKINRGEYVDGPKYRRSVDVFADKSRWHTKETFSGSADARIILWWEEIYYNWMRFFFTKEELIGKDRFGNRFVVRWEFYKKSEEYRACYRIDPKEKWHPYGGLISDDRAWEQWVRGRRGLPPTVAEEEYSKTERKRKLGPMVHEGEHLEDAAMRILRHMPLSGVQMPNIDVQDRNQELPGPLDAFAPHRKGEKADPELELKQRDKFHKATWTEGFIRGDVFYNEEETEILRSEIGDVFRSMRWAELEYKRQTRQVKAQPPVKRPDPATGEPAPFLHYTPRTDSYIPHVDAVPDLTSPVLERLILESQQYEDERLATRKELFLMDLGDVREGRGAALKDHDLYRPPPPSTRWRPQTWEETWGSSSGTLHWQ